MQRIFACVLLILCATQAGAQTCPEFYRFVDFGLKGSDGVVYRGGPVLRAESFSGEPLLTQEATACRAIQDVAVDGRGNPIPVVTAISYDPEATGIALTGLRVAKMEDTLVAADENAAAHLAALGEPGAVLTRGPDFLCVGSAQADGLSCQVQSPFSNSAALVVYCDPQECAMPVLAISDTLGVSAQWISTEPLMTDPDLMGAEISQKIQQIHNFLVPLSAAF